MKINLHQLELRLQSLIENRLAIFPWNRRQNHLAGQLVEAMQRNLTEHTDGRISAPGGYLLCVHPDTLSAWQSSPDLIDSLTQVLTGAANEAGIIFNSPPAIRLAADAALPPDALRIDVAALETRDGAADTAAIPAQPAQPEPDADTLPSGAFLILHGSQTYILQQAVINIGRRRDNHIVLDDPRISRAHAQLRAIRGHYVLFDLNSSGGCLVNGLRVTQQTLRPGDVISLAGVPLIYGEETPHTLSDTSTFYPEQSL